VMFWPGMASDIRDLVSQCSTCNSYEAQQQKEPLVLLEVPNTPWKIVAQDLFTYASSSYLSTVYYYSDFWELNTVPDTSSDTIAKNRHDNGPQFRAQIYEDFMNRWELITFPAPHIYHSQSNSKAEAAVKIAKTMYVEESHPRQHGHYMV